MSSPNLRVGTTFNQRRSQRILLAVPIQISGERANGAPFVEATRTVVVNAHGALIHLREAVLAGQKLRMKNLGTNEELLCKVIDINPGRLAIPEIGVAFTEPCPRFWRVSFPPEDWTPRCAEARRLVADDAEMEPPLVKK